MKKLIEIFGWYGTAAIVLAYALVSFSFLESNSIIYQLLNLTGALGIVLISLYAYISTGSAKYNLDNYCFYCNY